MIAGQSPRRVWQPNTDGQIRTIEEAIHIAQKYGVKIPDDVVFFVDESNELHQDKMACGPRVDLLSGERIHWYDLVHDLTGKVPFRIWSGILSSDEAIVAVLSHELYELEKLRPMLQEGSLSIDDFIHQTEPGRDRNFHDEAWDWADEMVDRMRGIYA